MTEDEKVKVIRDTANRLSLLAVPASTVLIVPPVWQPPPGLEVVECVHVELIPVHLHSVLNEDPTLREYSVYGAWKNLHIFVGRVAIPVTPSIPKEPLA